MQKVKTFNFVDENQLPMEKETISNCRKAIDVYRKLSKDKHYNVRISAFPTIVREQAKKHANQAFQPILKSGTEATQIRVSVTP